MKRTLAVGAVIAAILFVIGWVLWHPAGLATRTPDAATTTNPSAATTDPSTTTSIAAPLASALADRARRDELRRKILAAWAAGERGEEVAKEAKEGRFEEHPNANGDGIDPKFVQAAMREQMFPMLKDCYEEMTRRKPDAGGRVDLRFKIVADSQLGGIVDEDEDHDAGMVSGTLPDERFQTCVRESLMTVTFPPPAHGGVVTVGYPIELAPGDDDDQ